MIPNQKVWPTLFILLIFLMPVTSLAQQVALNEIMASNATTLADEDGDYEDWIEIVNYGNEPVNLKGYGLSDEYDDPFQWVFPDVTIQPGEFLLVWASNKDRTDPDAPLHSNFAISSAGEEILLTAPDSTRIDEHPPVEIPTDVSYGRFPDGVGTWVYFTEPTPGASNIGDPSSELLEPVRFSHNGGFYTSPIELELSHPDPDVTIIYTLDGSEPDINNLNGTTYQYKNQYPYRRNDPFGPFLTQTYTSLLYESSLWIQDRSSEPDKLTQISSTSHFEPGYFPDSPVRKGTVVRARAYKPGTIPSRLTGHTYFVWADGNPYELPVISIQIQENYLFDYDIGIYNAGVDFDTWRSENPDINLGNRPEYGNYWRRGIEWEYPGNIEIFSPKSFETIINQGAGIRTHGNFSRILPIKNLRFYARGQYDTENVFEHELFDNSIPNVHSPNNNVYNRMLMRGDGAGGPVFYDVVFNRLMQPVFDGVTRIQPAIHFINGEYFGITAIRDRMDRHHFAYFYNQDADNILHVDCKGFRDCNFISGDETETRIAYEELRDFIRDNNLARPDNYAHV